MNRWQIVAGIIKWALVLALAAYISFLRATH